ncbi:polyprenol monophosphomannose synthase [Sediminibacterium roseum]|uniref:Polyprenol monophosphomannose synthase n=1 Tax=Sediminibacterium roseum TaxID=1978412 RepID=A0ABW9ZTC2_9BACT|nr:polyprenol monophosphomannose synthase [Sediminibacterium roseum]NCI50371.1 polyprenol monophosphomannose synthase [Sediminibacterium roseum]
MEKIVIIPTYNEKENIVSIITAVFALGSNFHVLVIDDGSPDGTGNIVRDLINVYPGQLFLEERSGKLGLGTAYIHGFKWSIAKGYAYIFEMDADFSHNPNDLLRLYNACKNEGADVAIGSRYVPGGKTENWPLDRQLYSRGGAFYTKLITWMPVNDPTAGFLCYKRKVLESINFDMIQFVGYAFQIEMKFAAWKLGFKIKEVPITFIDRKIGVSKMSKGIIREGVLGVLRIQWKSLFSNYRKKVKNDVNDMVTSKAG